MNSKQNPTGLTTVALGTPLSVVIGWIAQQLGLEMEPSVAVAFGAIVTSALAAVVSYFTPRNV